MITSVTVQVMDWSHQSMIKMYLWAYVVVVVVGLTLLLEVKQPVCMGEMYVLCVYMDIGQYLLHAVYIWYCSNAMLHLLPYVS